MMFELTPDGAAKRLEQLTAIVDQLVAAGATSRAATDAQKWEVGDVINTLGQLAGPALGRARRGVFTPSASAPPSYQTKFRDLRERLVTDQETSRSALVDFARVALVLPPDDPLRQSELGFFFARALSVVENPIERLRWAEETVRRGYSVARLRAALNASRGEQKPAFIDSLPSPKESTHASKENTHASKEGAPAVRSSAAEKTGKEQRGIYVCAQTRQRIVDLAAMVEVYLDRDHPAAPAPLPGRNRRAILRFVNLSALAVWSAAHSGAADALALKT